MHSLWEHRILADEFAIVASVMTVTWQNWRRQYSASCLSNAHMWKELLGASIIKNSLGKQLPDSRRQALTHKPRNSWSDNEA
jgi:hypothetical protein